MKNKSILYRIERISNSAKTDNTNENIFLHKLICAIIAELTEKGHLTETQYRYINDKLTENSN